MTTEPTVTRCGNLTGDPTLHYSTKGTPRATFGLAVTSKVRKADGALADGPPAFYDVVTFGDLAEHVVQCLDKGDRVVVTGHERAESWTGKDGRPRTSQKVVAHDVGPSLRFVPATIERVSRRGPSTVQRRIMAATTAEGVLAR